MGLKDALMKGISILVEDESKPRPAASSQSSRHDPSSAASAHRNDPSPHTNAAATDMPAASHAIAGSNGLNIEELAASLKQLVEQEPAFGAYRDFLDKAHKLEKAVPDEAQRFAAALDLTGTSLDALLASVRAYAAVVERENGRFEAHFAGAAQQAIDDLKSQDAALQQEIDTLSQRLAEANARKADNTRAITEHTSSLAKARIDFDAARSTVAQYYEGVAHKLQTNLGATHGQ